MAPCGCYMCLKINNNICCCNPWNVDKNIRGTLGVLHFPGEKGRFLAEI